MPNTPLGWDKSAGGGATVNAGTSAGQMVFFNATSGEYDYTAQTEQYWDDTSKILFTKNIKLPACTTSTGGVYYVSGNRFIHNFQHPTGGGAVPTGKNTFMGELSGNFTIGSGATIATHGSFNSCYGYNTGNDLTNGSYNALYGWSAGDAITVGLGNCAFGADALSGVTNQSSNCAFGYQAGRLLNDANNVFMGYLSGSFLASGGNNVCAGYLTCYKDSTNSNVTACNTSIFIGPNAGPNGNTQTNQIAIGNGAKGNGSNTTVIGNSATTNTEIFGTLTTEGLTTYKYSASLADDATISVATSKAGFGTVSIGDNQEYAHFTFSTTAVTLISNSANVSNTSADGFLCIHVASNVLKIMNALGSPLTVRASIDYA